jgi:signal transduction histidine kinase
MINPRFLFNPAHESKPARAPDWNKLIDCDHVVQFYEDEHFLLKSLSAFVAEGLRAGDGCLVVATKEHNEELSDLLKARRFDVSSALTSEQYIRLDAAETLEKIMVDGSPVSGIFLDLMGEKIGRASGGQGRVRIFGEMVALLWSEGNSHGALRLESLWNELQKSQSFTLFCAYPVNFFSGEKDRGLLDDVCTAHSNVIPSDAYSRLSTEEDRLREIIGLQQKALILELEIARRKEVEQKLRTSQIRLQKEIKKRQALLEREQTANRMKDEFLATLSHEMRTPLTPMLGWARALRSGSLTADNAARALEAIESSVETQTKLVQDLLDVSRIIAGKLQLERTTLSLHSVIKTAIQILRPSAEAKNICIETIMECGGENYAGDFGRLQQVVWNLLSNAIKFTPPGGFIEIRLSRISRHYEIKVSDSGAGISSNFLPHVFDRFRQADGTTTRKYGGLGLGLAIVRHLVELHGGTVRAESEGEGRGSIFTVTLPLTKSPRRV